MLLGACLTWGLLWPWIASKEGSWYPAGLGEKSFSGLFGYQVFLTISLIMGDGLYNLGKVLYASAHAFVRLQQERSYRSGTSGSSNLVPATAAGGGHGSSGSSDLGRRHSGVGAGVSVYGSAEGGWQVSVGADTDDGDLKAGGVGSGALTQPLLGGDGEEDGEVAPHAAKESHLVRGCQYVFLCSFVFCSVSTGYCTG